MQKDPVRRMPSAQQQASVLESLYMPRPRGRRPVWARGWAVGIGTALIVASLYPIGVWLHVWPARDGAMPIRSLAVPPVANFTHDPGQQDVA